MNWIDKARSRRALNLIVKKSEAVGGRSKRAGGREAIPMAIVQESIPEEHLIPTAAPKICS
jgi:hypothetical protein